MPSPAAHRLPYCAASYRRQRAAHAIGVAMRASRTLRMLVPPIAATCAACATPRMNLPLEHPVTHGQDGYYIGSSEADRTNRDETFVVLAAAGGGTRAAAFTYGALQAMQQTEIGAGKTLLDDLDLITSVSGGSFAAAYYGLFPEEFFSRFPEDFLYRSMGRGLALRMASPRNLLRLMSPAFSRSDLAAEYYGEEFFRNRTFADMPRTRPWIAINATDLSSGAQFPFTQNQFDVLCSDLDSVPLGRAVAASAAVPVAFPPLTLRNYPKSTCGYTTPAWAKQASSGSDVAPRMRALANNWLSYENAGHRPYLHVGDGALSDNTGLRGFLDFVDMGDALDVSARIERGEIRTIVVVVVDALANVEFAADRHLHPPGAAAVLEASLVNQLQSYSAEMVQRLHTWFEQWDEAARRYDALRVRCEALGRRAPQCQRDMAIAEPPRPRLYVIQVRLEAIPDDGVRKKLGDPKTVIQLKRSEGKLLVEWAGWLMRSSPDYRKLLADRKIR
ncbi:MAG: patatin-like phospholipase family protein [Candidatus Binatia bacterium]